MLLTKKDIHTWYTLINYMQFINPFFLLITTKKSSVKNCFIRGSVVRYVQLPAQAIDTALLQDAARREAAQPSTAQQTNVKVK